MVPFWGVNPYWTVFIKPCEKTWWFILFIKAFSSTFPPILIIITIKLVYAIQYAPWQTKAYCVHCFFWARSKHSTLVGLCFNLLLRCMFKNGDPSHQTPSLKQTALTIRFNRQDSKYYGPAVLPFPMLPSINVKSAISKFFQLAVKSQTLRNINYKRLVSYKY